jgi:hypothetical protein
MFRDVWSVEQQYHSTHNISMYASTLLSDTTNDNNKKNNKKKNNNHNNNNMFAKMW